MAVTFDFYSDAALTTVLTELATVHLIDGSGSPQDRKVYLDSPQASRKAQADSQPDVDPITVSVIDADTGAGGSVNAVRLATTQVGLDSATPGAAL
ncbi:MAG: hypothetical protein J5I81_14590 [Nitrococcus mobilis]|nr:hypothetical protein [Nitrococcus mobilis]